MLLQAVPGCLPEYSLVVLVRVPFLCGVQLSRLVLFLIFPLPVFKSGSEW